MLETAMVSVKNLDKHYGDRMILQDISFEAHKGSCLGILGPNGSGKSTLIRLISGLQPPTSGEIRIQDRTLPSISPRQLARLLAVVAQDPLPAHPVSVYEAVMMGRYPHLSWFAQERQEDVELVLQVLEQTGILHLQNQPLASLSGGERQRVAIARAMVQSPRLLLLDEPTAFLDIGHQTAVLNLVKKWQKECELAVIMVIHDLNLAAQYCDRILLLHEGRMVKMGTAEEVFRREILEQVYETRTEIIEHPLLGVPQVLLTGGRV